MDPVYDTDYCTTPGENWLAEALRAGYCGLATVISVPAQAWVGVTENAEGAAIGVTGNAADASIGVAGELGDAASPWNLFGLGAGGAVGVAAVGLVGAFAADWLLFGGSGTASVARTIGLRSGRR